ncbi:MAG: DUF1513 domain-containing protein [Amaricoccus sp.]
MRQGNTTRRGFLRRTAGIGAVGLIPGVAQAAEGPARYLAAATAAEGHVLVGLAAGGTEAFRLSLPGAGHAAAAHPDRPEAVAFGRAPMGFTIVVDTVAGRALTRIDPAPGRHLAGHGAFDAGAWLLFAAEAADDGSGYLGIHDGFGGYRRVGEVPTGGRWPHAVLLMPDGERLAVANAGTPEGGSSLAYLDAASGEILDRLEPPDPGLAIRHLAVAPDGTLVATLGWSEPDGPAPGLLAVHRPGTPGLVLFAALPTLGDAAGDIAVSADGRLAAVAGSRGGIVSFDLATGAVAGILPAAGACGVAAAADGFVCATSEGAVFLPAADGPALHLLDLAFAEHLTLL